MKRLFSMGIILSILSITIGSCKKDKTDIVEPSTDLKFDLNLSTSPTLGQYISNKKGLALYMFANDADGAASCSGACENLWPAATIDLATATFDAGLLPTDFATITTTSGKKQITYKGWPLYTYSPPTTDYYGATSNVPEAAGATRGDAVGAVWFIAKPDYTIMLANKQLTGLDGNTYKPDYTIGTGKTVYFTAAKGRTIYTFSVDSFNINKFTRADFSNNTTWPIYEQEQIIVPSILNKALFGSITVAGKKQMTYKGWPLYYFGQDTERGQNKGVSVPVAGRWPVAVKDIIEARR